MATMNLLVIRRAVLNPPIRVVNQWVTRLPALECHLKGPADLLGLQTVMHVVSHYFSGVNIGHQAQIHILIRGGQIGDVRHPDLLRCTDPDLLLTFFEQVRVPPEMVMAVRGLVVHPLGLHQHSGATQNVKQRISAQLDLGIVQRFSEQVVQLAGAKPGLLQALLRHPADDTAFALGALTLAMALLVIGLTTYAYVTASPGHTQALDEAAREDLPKGFFVTLTP